MSGGQGKTTNTLMVGKKLAALGIETLLVDCNAQASLTFFSGVEIQPDEPTLYELLCGVEGIEVKDALNLVSGYENLYLLGADEGLYRARTMMAESGIGALLLAQRLSEVDDFFQVCLIDSPPEHQDFINMAIVAADLVFIPVQANSKGVNSLLRTLNVLQLLKKVKAFRGKVAGVIPFLDDWRGFNQTRTSSEAIEALKEIAAGIPAPVLPSIRLHNKIERAIEAGVLPSQLATTDADRQKLSDLEYPFDTIAQIIKKVSEAQ